MRLIFLSALVLLSLGLAHGAAVVNSENGIDKIEVLPLPEEDDKRKNDHQKFFEKLTPLEREWVLRLAIKQERDELTRRLPNVILPVLGPFKQPRQPQRQRHQFAAGAMSENNGIKPIDSLDMVPPGLLDYMLNGQITPLFQKDLIRWLRDAYGFNDVGFLSFSSNSNEYCQGDKCWDLGDIGGECCPFG